MTSSDLKQRFTAFFIREGHKLMPPSSLIPDDPTTLFTTAGMQQFKRFYQSPDQAPASRAVTIQPCFRTSDIEEVGDKTHLTFFEMLGNFSFGYPTLPHSYFKKEAIDFAWRFLTEPAPIGLGVAKDRIHATYFQGDNLVNEDVESRQILESYLDKGLTRVVGQSFDDNFWSLGTEGSPGGPTVEFYIDGVEIWNLVFNEYIFQNGQYIPATHKGVDTGMGLERMIAVLNQADSVYDIDTFDTPRQKLHQLIKQENSRSERIILDHIRGAVFLLDAGVEPSNIGRGYVARRLIRRSIATAKQLGINDNFLTRLAEPVIDLFQEIYHLDRTGILAGLNHEEEKFRKTIIQAFNAYKKIAFVEHERNNTTELIPSRLTGMDLFNLFQNHGLPPEVAIEQAKQDGVTIAADALDKFNELMQKHQELSRAGAAAMFKGGLSGTGEQEVKYHTATHLLNQALRDVLGNHVQQKGSNITPERLRFDFSHPAKLTPEQITQIEKIVNDKITADLPVHKQEMTLDEAKKLGAQALFDSKYGNTVCVYTIGDDKPYSIEVCGGPHVARTGALGRFKIIKEEASSAGIRRLKAILK